VEAFFVAVTACLVLGVGVWALAAMRHLSTFTDRRAGDD
jgi:hypothetical protein